MTTLPAFPVGVAVLPRAGFPVDLAADEAARAAIAAHAGVTAIERLEARLLFSRWLRGGVEVTGRLRASLEQPCVVTLDPVRQEIDENVLMRFVPAGSELARAGAGSPEELILDPEGEDPPEPFDGEAIDAWAVAIESLVLAIDPFPRAPGAHLPEQARDAESDDFDAESPFAALKKLKTGLSDPGAGA